MTGKNELSAYRRLQLRFDVELDKHNSLGVFGTMT